MNFLAHIYLSGENDDVKFGNFIGDFVKGKKYKKYRDDIKKGILLHREIDSYTDKHPIVHKSIERMRPAYGKYAGVVIDILYDHFLAKNWEQYSSEKLENFVIDFNYLVLERLGKIPRKARAFAFPFLRKKRLLCYANLTCFEEVLQKMAIYTSMPNYSKEAMKIINKNYNLFEDEFTNFFKDLQEHVKEFV
ncbi:MAG: DUF479 domain-containing protein [Chlorobi bacterium]|nr:DUF479 domain-containing protein [Chlorobiota bacterium]